MGAASNPMLDQAMVEFKDKQFDAALLKIQELLSKSPENDTLNYYAGLCYFETLKNKDAIQYFAKVTDKNSYYYLQARYNEGLAYIRDDNTTAAKTSLGIVADSEPGPLQKQAAELLAKI
jgi:predicted Zn-dependent protease